MPDILSRATILAGMERAEKAVCGGDPRCYGFPYTVQDAIESQTPDGWVNIGWVCANSGRLTWDAWYHLDSGKGKLKRHEGES